MKCEHGNDIKVIIDVVAPSKKDPGIVLYNYTGLKSGEKITSDMLKIKGCDECERIGVSWGKYLVEV